MAGLQSFEAFVLRSLTVVSTGPEIGFEKTFLPLMSDEV
jgi:hypothetical protein